jgi:sulfur transfer complex TusBCD TusB component (DsrH family)
MIIKENAYFDDIVKPPPKKSALKEDVEAEDNQEFLKKVRVINSLR